MSSHKKLFRPKHYMYLKKEAAYNINIVIAHSLVLATNAKHDFK